MLTNPFPCLQRLQESPNKSIVSFFLNLKKCSLSRVSVPFPRSRTGLPCSAWGTTTSFRADLCPGSVHRSCATNAAPAAYRLYNFSTRSCDCWQLQSYETILQECDSQPFYGDSHPLLPTPTTPHYHLQPRLSDGRGNLSIIIRRLIYHKICIFKHSFFLHNIYTQTHIRQFNYKFLKQWLITTNTTTLTCGRYTQIRDVQSRIMPASSLFCYGLRSSRINRSISG